MFTVKSKFNGGIYVIGEAKLKSESNDWEVVEKEDNTKSVEVDMSALKSVEEVKMEPSTKTFVKYVGRKPKVK